MRLGSSGAVLVLLAIAGCGGGDDSFTQDFNRAVTPISRLGGDPGAQPENYDQLARRTRRTRENLARLDAPDGAQDELDALVAGLDEVTRSLVRVARATKSKDPVRQRRAARRLEDATGEFRRAENALHRAVGG
jgi:hypothetical protein